MASAPHTYQIFLIYKPPNIALGTQNSSYHALIAELRARSPIAKKIWETHECEKFWFPYDVTYPSVRRPTMLMRPCLFGGKLHGEMRLQQKC